MTKFRSRTALAEHIKMLVKEGYLVPSWHNEIRERNIVKIKLFKVNFKAVKNNVNKRTMG